MKLTLVTNPPMNRLELDEFSDRVRIVQAAVDGTPLPVGLQRSRSAGAYLLLYRGDFAPYRQLRRPRGARTLSMAAGGGWPLYAGVAVDISERSARHRTKLSKAVNLDVDDFELVALETDSHAAALYAEAVLIAELQPLANQYWMSGLGSKKQGKVRERGQRVTPWNRLHQVPRHPGAQPDSANLKLIAKIEEHLAATVTEGYRHRIMR